MKLDTKPSGSFLTANALQVCKFINNYYYLNYLNTVSTLRGIKEVETYISLNVSCEGIRSFSN